MSFFCSSKLEIELSFKSLDGYGVKIAYQEEAIKAFIARGLSIYAWQQIEQALEISQLSSSGKYIYKAVAAIPKASLNFDY